MVRTGLLIEFAYFRCDAERGGVLVKSMVVMAGGLHDLAQAVERLGFAEFVAYYAKQRAGPAEVVGGLLVAALQHLHDPEIYQCGAFAHYGASLTVELKRPFVPAARLLMPALPQVAVAKRAQRTAF